MGARCDGKWNELLVCRPQSSNGGGCDKPSPFVIITSRSGQTSCWPRIAEVPLQGLKSAGAFVLCTRAEVSERLAHDEWGGVFLFLRKGIFCVQKMVRNDRCRRSNRCTALRSTNDCCLLGKCRSGLGAHTSLDLVRG